MEIAASGSEDRGAGGGAPSSSSSSGYARFIPKKEVARYDPYHP